MPVLKPRFRSASRLPPSVVKVWNTNVPCGVVSAVGMLFSPLGVAKAVEPAARRMARV